jgi:hypothetical protein
MPIAVIEGNQASQFGIGMAPARIAETQSAPTPLHAMPFRRGRFQQKANNPRNRACMQYCAAGLSSHKEKES